MTPSLRSVMIASAIFAVATGTSSASVITIGCEDPSNCLLIELISGGSIQVDDKIFSGFGFSPTGSDPAPQPSGVSVTPVGIGTLAPGLRFSSLDQFLSGPNPQGQNFIITYNVSIAPGSMDRITDIEFIFDAPITLTGTAGITGLEVANCTGDTGLQPRRELNLTATATGAKDTQNTAAPATSCDVFKQLMLSGGVNGFAQILSFENKFSETPIPEPSSLVILATGLFLLKTFARRAVRRPHRRVDAGLRHELVDGKAVP